MQNTSPPHLAKSNIKIMIINDIAKTLFDRESPSTPQFLQENFEKLFKSEREENLVGLINTIRMKERRSPDLSGAPTKKALSTIAKHYSTETQDTSDIFLVLAEKYLNDPKAQQQCLDAPDQKALEFLAKYLLLENQVENLIKLIHKLATRSSKVAHSEPQDIQIKNHTESWIEKALTTIASHPLANTRYIASMFVLIAKQYQSDWAEEALRLLFACAILPDEGKYLIELIKKPAVENSQASPRGRREGSTTNFINEINIDLFFAIAKQTPKSALAWKILGALVENISLNNPTDNLIKLINELGTRGSGVISNKTWERESLAVIANYYPRGYPYDRGILFAVVISRYRADPEAKEALNVLVKYTFNHQSLALLIDNLSANDLSALSQSVPEGGDLMEVMRDYLLKVKDISTLFLVLAIQCTANNEAPGALNWLTGYILSTDPVKNLIILINNLSTESQSNHRRNSWIESALITIAERYPSGNKNIGGLFSALTKELQNNTEAKKALIALIKHTALSTSTFTKDNNSEQKHSQVTRDNIKWVTRDKIRVAPEVREELRALENNQELTQDHKEKIFAAVKEAWEEAYTYMQAKPPTFLEIQEAEKELLEDQAPELYSEEGAELAQNHKQSIRATAVKAARKPAYSHTQSKPPINIQEAEEKLPEDQTPALGRDVVDGLFPNQDKKLLIARLKNKRGAINEQSSEEEIAGTIDENTWALSLEAHIQSVVEDPDLAPTQSTTQSSENGAIKAYPWSSNEGDEEGPSTILETTTNKFIDHPHATSPPSSVRQRS